MYLCHSLDDYAGSFQLIGPFNLAHYLATSYIISVVGLV